MVPNLPSINYPTYYNYNFSYQNFIFEPYRLFCNFIVPTILCTRYFLSRVLVSLIYRFNSDRKHCYKISLFWAIVVLSCVMEL